METSTYYVIQFWVEGYEYWATAKEASEGLFDLPRWSYESLTAGMARLEFLREANPATTYRLTQITETRTVIDPAETEPLPEGVDGYGISGR